MREVVAGWRGCVLAEERAEDEDEEDDEDDEAEDEEVEEEEELESSADSETEEDEDEVPEVVSDADVEVSDTVLVVEGLITGGGAQGSYKCPYCTSELEVESSETLALSSLLESSDSDAEELVVELL